jgi:hypothetical protein
LLACRSVKVGEDAWTETRLSLSGMGLESKLCGRNPEPLMSALPPKADIS